VVDALDGELSPAETEKLKLVRLHKEYLNYLRDTLEALIMELARPFARQIELFAYRSGHQRAFDCSAYSRGNWRRHVRI